MIAGLICSDSGAMMTERVGMGIRGSASDEPTADPVNEPAADFSASRHGRISRMSDRTIELVLPPRDDRAARVWRLYCDLQALGGEWQIHSSPGAVSKLRITGPDSEEMQRLIVEAAEDLEALRDECYRPLEPPPQPPDIEARLARWRAATAARYLPASALDPPPKFFHGLIAHPMDRP